MSILDKLQKSSTLSGTAILSESKIFADKEMVSTSVPMINVALSGKTDGGLSSGLTVLAGPSKHFKTSFALLMAAAYLDAHKDSIILFYDSEFGSPQSYFESFGIDTNRVLHTPVTNIEELKFDIVKQLGEITRKDKVIIVLDSIGNIASLKETQDAENQKSVADMSRAKALKSLFRMITPQLTLNDIPCLAINHIYMEQGMFPKAIVSGGTGVYYSADNIWIVGRRQEKDGTEIKGYHFVINVEKSRFVKEKSKIPITVTWEGGIEKHSGLLELAQIAGFVVKPKNAWYNIKDPNNAEGVLLPSNVRAQATFNNEFWDKVFEAHPFKEWIQEKFQIGHAAMLTDED